MGVRFTHTHPDGTACYRVRSSWPLKPIVVIDVGGQSYGAGFMGYTGSWYLYDLTTGKEVGRIDREVFEASFKRLVVCELQEDEEGKCVATKVGAA